MVVSQDLVMEPVNGGPASAIFRCFLQWAPTNSSNQLAGITLGNGAKNATLLGTLPGAENVSWEDLYAKTKLSKVVVQYFPAVTQGMSVTTVTAGDPVINPLCLSAASQMYTVPIYDNVDSIINSVGAINGATTRSSLENILVKPYSKNHSVYKPWTRILKPTKFMEQGTYQGASTFYKSGRWDDLSNPDVQVNGLMILMPPLTLGGLQSTIIPVQSAFPGANEVFVLGRLQMTYYQKFKTRT